MVKIENGHIFLTRGDTFSCKVNIFNADGTEYIPESDDVIRFAMKRTIDDRKPVISKIIPNDTMILAISSNDTKKLFFGDYLYDIQITFANGDVDTFIPVNTFTLEMEVD